MPKLEKDIQNRFFDILIEQNREFEKATIGVYQKLVYTRYEEVIKNSFPLFVDEISQKELENTVKKFILKAAKTPFVWQVPNEYRKFVKKTKLFDDKKYLYELMFYDWIEIEIYMKEYKLKKQKEFSYRDKYKVSKSSRIKKFKYDIINKKYSTKRENFVVIYYDFETHNVVFREINQLIYILIKRLSKDKSIGKVLKQLCKENDINYDEAKDILLEPLKELYFNRVFF